VRRGKVEDQLTALARDHDLDREPFEFGLGLPVLEYLRCLAP
jgi:hypothetical protein